MCGITGAFSLDGLGKYRTHIQAANDLVTHRGPDGAGFALFGTNPGKSCLMPRKDFLPDSSAMAEATLALGHRRLAIIDLSDAGLQPMPNHDSSLWIVFNGEIYNYIEVREELKQLGCSFTTQTDTEVILAAYEVWGENCVNHFNGMWSLALVDLKRMKLFCSRDRFGVKPFYYYYDGRRFVFGSEIKQLLQFPFVPRQINERAVYEYLALQALEYDDETFFGGIRKLFQGHSLLLNLEDGSLTVRRYYDPALAVNRNITLSEAAAEFRHLLTDAVRLRLRSDVEVGSCLSGGLDSSSIVCLMSQLLRQEGKGHGQRTFSSHFDDPDADEIAYMQEVIGISGVNAAFTYPTSQNLLDDLEKLVWHQDEPFGSTSTFAEWSVYKLVSQHKIKVTLDGQGPDEMLAGYLGTGGTYFKEMLTRRQFVRLAREVSRYVSFHGAWKVAPMLGRIGQAISQLAGRPPVSTDWIAPQLAERHCDHSNYQRTYQHKPFGERAHLNNRLYQLTFFNNLQTHLKSEDRNSMAFSVESRLPFLDYRLVEFLFSLPSDFKIRDGYTKYVMRQGIAGVIPEKVRLRTSKFGFATPERDWLKHALDPHIRQTLGDERLRPYLVPERALAYFTQIQRHNQLDFAPWRWLNLSLWMKAYDLG